jgi:hypothetical protein
LRCEFNDMTLVLMICAICVLLKYD